MGPSMALVYYNVKLVNSINKILSNISIYTVLYIHKDKFIIIILKIHLLKSFNFIWIIIRHLEIYITYKYSTIILRETKSVPVTKKYYTKGQGYGV